jgi:hypothetical protein
VPGCVRYRETCPASKVFDASVTLAEMFEQFEPMRVAEGLSDLRKAGEDAQFRTEA